METICPHCAQVIEADEETLASLAGATHFACPACSGEVSVPAPSARGQARVASRRLMHRNLVVLGSAILVLLGALAIYLATRPPVTDKKTVASVKEENIANQFFTDLVAAGRAKLDDLQQVGEIRRFGQTHLGITKKSLTWSEAGDFAARVGGEVLLVDLAGSKPERGQRPNGQTERLLNLLEETYPERCGSTLWVRDHTGDASGGDARVIDIPLVWAVTTPDRPRPALIHWRPAPPKPPLAPHRVSITSTDPPLSTDPGNPTRLRVGTSLKATITFDNTGPNPVKGVLAVNADDAVFATAPGGEMALGPGNATLTVQVNRPGTSTNVTATLEDTATKAPVALATLPGHAVWELDPDAWQLELVSVDPPHTLDRENRKLRVTARTGQPFTVRHTVRYKTPEATKLAANFLLRDAKILPAATVATLEARHDTTWHFDTESRPGYQSATGPGTLSFDLSGIAPPKAGTYAFRSNLGLFDKRTWDPLLFQFFDVTLVVTDPDLTPAKP